MRQFVPMTDELLYRTDRLPGPLVPYRCGLPCWHRLQDEPPAPGAAAATAMTETPAPEQTVSA
jgi:hypothetical protein